MPTEEHRSDIPLTTAATAGTSFEEGEMVSYNGDMSIDDLCDTLDREHEVLHWRNSPLGKRIYLAILFAWLLPTSIKCSAKYLSRKTTTRASLSSR